LIDAVYRNFCDQAVAYLQPTTPTTRTVDLTRPDIPVITDLGNGLLATYVVVQDDKLRYVQQCHLVEAGLSQAQLHHQAVVNLTLLTKTKTALIQPHGDVFVVLCGGSFEASLILIDELWENTLNHFAPNGFIAAFPCRDILAFCDAGSATGIEQLRQIITRAEEGDHHITPVPYYRSEATWRSYAN